MVAGSEGGGAVRRLLPSGRAGRAGLVALLALGAVAVAAPVVAPYDPLAQGGMPFEDFSLRHLLGTDELGRDMLSRLLYGLRLSLLVALATALCAGTCGVAAGLVAGYAGGWLDAVIMRATDVVLSVPAILLAVVLVAILGGGVGPLVVAIAIVGAPAFARLTRAGVLTVKEREYVLASRVAGASTMDLVLRTVLPNVMGPVVSQFVVTASTAVLTEAGLDFLGLGSPPPAPSLGAMLAAGNENLFVAPSYPVVVGAAIGLLVVAFDLVGTSLQRTYGGAGRGGVAA